MIYSEISELIQRVNKLQNQVDTLYELNEALRLRLGMSPEDNPDLQEVSLQGYVCNDKMTITKYYRASHIYMYMYMYLYMYNVNVLSHTVTVFKFMNVKVREKREKEVTSLREHNQSLLHEVERLEDEKLTLRKRLVEQATSR